MQRWGPSTVVKGCEIKTRTNKGRVFRNLQNMLVWHQCYYGYWLWPWPSGTLILANGENRSNRKFYRRECLPDCAQTRQRSPVAGCLIFATEKEINKLVSGAFQLYAHESGLLLGSDGRREQSDVGHARFPKYLDSHRSGPSKWSPASLWSLDWWCGNQETAKGEIYGYIIGSIYFRLM